MKQKIKLMLLPLLSAGVLVACSTTQQTTAYKTIGAAETAVINANSAYLDAVVTGHASTNSVPTVEAAFNDTQIALHTAAALASGGANAPVPAATAAKVDAFINQSKTTK